MSFFLCVDAHASMAHFFLHFNKPWIFAAYTLCEFCDPLHPICRSLGFSNVLGQCWQKVLLGRLITEIWPQIWTGQTGSAWIGQDSLLCLVGT